ncbi:OsmC family protein [Pseudooceanicola sp. LIPI14-2-Ac024]|uniref:OsmC family protein n=1 Tax=Pseudooceanicola sp. LIPI14-2-Ac024 TaxID=3344875 RepID=UPI0035CEC207
MKHDRFDLKSPSFGPGFAKLRNLIGPEVFTDWFASRNRIRPQAAGAIHSSENADLRPLSPVPAQPEQSTAARPQTQPRKETKMTTATQTVNNGVDTESLIGARGAFAQAPHAAQFTFRSTCDWIEGTYNVNAINGYFGLGQEHKRAQTYRIESDHPEVFHAGDRAPTPPEIVLSALASCLTGGVAAVAQHRGIQLKKVRAVVEGDVDVQGILGMDPEIRNGFSAIRVTFDIDADATRDEIAALVAQSQKRSAVFDILTNPTNVAVSVA